MGKFQKLKPPSLYKGRNGFNYALSLWETMLACKVSYIHNEYNVRIIVWNSLCNKYTDCNKDFSPPLAKDFYKNWEVFFTLCDAIVDINNISLEKQYTMDEDIMWKNLT